MDPAPRFPTQIPRSNPPGSFFPRRARISEVISSPIDEMAHTLCYVPSPGQTVLVSVRCFQARFLLRPSERVNKLILGVLAKAQEKYQVPIFAPSFLSNHGHLLAWFRDAEHQAKFMHFVDGNIAREVGRHHRWKGKFWDQPFSSSLVADDEAWQVTI